MLLEVGRRQIDLGERGNITVVYSVISEYDNEFMCDMFGVSVRIDESGEEEKLAGITSLAAEAFQLAYFLINGKVTPVTLKDVVSDWIAQL